MLKKHPLRMLKLADKDCLAAVRSRGLGNDGDNGGRLSLDFVNVVKLSEDQSTSREHGGGQPSSEAYIS